MSRVEVIGGDCLDVLPTLSGYDACVTDPPYHLTSIVDRFGKSGAAPAKHGTDGAYARASRGFMGKQWDGGSVAFEVATWRLVFDALKPGAHVAAFGGTRTFHRMAVAIEDAGFEIRDCLSWNYGQGFPKSHNQGNGWGTALKPAWEPIILARKPLIGTVAANVLAHGTGAINIDACRIPYQNDYRTPCRKDGSVNSGGSFGAGVAEAFDNNAREQAGRWPANVLHDGSPEVEAAFAAFGDREGGGGHVKKRGASVHCMGAANDTTHIGIRDSGSASRFFYCAKASKSDRAGSSHPTVKPLALMRWLCTLITPQGGRILDPFAGSGTTLQAAHDCGFSATGIERDPEYQADIRRRIASLEVAPDSVAAVIQRDLFVEMTA